MKRIHWLLAGLGVALIAGVTALILIISAVGAEPDQAPAEKPPPAAAAATATRADAEPAPVDGSLSIPPPVPKTPEQVLPAAEKAELLKAARSILKERETLKSDLLGSWASSPSGILAILGGLAVLILGLALLAGLQVKAMSALRNYPSPAPAPTPEEWRRLMEILTKQSEMLRDLQGRVQRIERGQSGGAVNDPVVDRPPPPVIDARPDRHFIDPRPNEDETVRDVLADYARMLANREDELPAFEQKYSPRSLRAVEAGASEFMAEHGSRLVWAVPVNSRWILVPGPVPITRWFNYQSADGAAAKDSFGGAYELLRGESTLRIARPAWAEEVNGRFYVKEPGQLAGALPS